MSSSSFALRDNTDLIEDNYRRWKADPDSVDASWRSFFEGFELGSDTSLSALLAAPGAPVDGLRQSKVASLIYAYRSVGHLQAHIDPLGVPPPPHPRLSLQEFGLEESDLDMEFDVGHYLQGGRMKLRDLITSLQRTYCGRIGVEYVHIQDVEIRRWLQQKMEPVGNAPTFPRARKIRILRKLFEAEIFERFLHTRFVGQKRFSLEGAETLVPVLDAVVEKMAVEGMKELVLGMAHRGRLNILCNIFGKSYEYLFTEFSENYIPDLSHGDGDVKYHLGYENEVVAENGSKIGLRMAANPSHLEAVNPVVEGKTRARQRIVGDTEERRAVLPVLIHGDAAFAGQGMVAEVLNMSMLPGYRTGGTLHLVVNNQIGFTTNPDEARSTRYCTDVAKMIEAPIFHVNGDDPLSAVFVAELALEFRQKFRRDVVIDIVCYRKHGHNETDEPLFTQPIMYSKIAKHPPISEILTSELLETGMIDVAGAEKLKADFQATLDSALATVKKKDLQAHRDKARLFRGSNAVLQPDYSFAPVSTGVPKELLLEVGRGLTRIPETFAANPKIKRLFEQRLAAIEKGEGLDWGTAEALAFGTLLHEGTPVRLSGQDSERGTFSHRHAVIYDMNNRDRWVPANHLRDGQARFCVYNSLLSEAAVLGFDYGYSLDYPQMLCIWEAQFGDFANGAQVIIDQFIASSEMKWGRPSGITLLLPHGYEGQGPEHSSARLERFLQLCAEDNLQVVNPTTPAQIFHCLRRQVRRELRKPLVVMSPKSLLRLPAASSKLEELSDGRFFHILDDPQRPANKQIDRVILCSGKVYYDLHDFRVAQKRDHVALVRVEQLYPLNTQRIRELVPEGKSVDVVWCQDEPQNMGAWSFVAPQLEAALGRKPRYAGRKASASPAVGSLAVHKIEQSELIRMAFEV